MAALRAEDPTTIAEVLTELLPRVRGWLFRLLGPAADLDDATQDALTEIAAALPRYEGRSSLGTMAHTITVRVAYRYYGVRKKKARERNLVLVSPPPAQADPESRAIGRQAVRHLHRALAKLKPKRRTAVVLCALEGLTPSQAAEVEGVSASTMRSRLMHGRLELERLLMKDPFVASLLGRTADV
jgi:RNA polymerase sigma-70 factor (ECF subfamily)